MRVPLSPDGGGVELLLDDPTQPYLIKPYKFERQLIKIHW